MSSLRLHYLQHVPFEDPANILPWAKGRNYQISHTKFFLGESRFPKMQDLDFVLIMGGPMSIHDEQKFPWLIEEKRFIERAISHGKVVLGICLGAQLIASVFGARVKMNKHKEMGWFPVETYQEEVPMGLGLNWPREMTTFHWHSEIFDIPAGAIRLASSIACENQAFVWHERVIGLQFHLEMNRSSISSLIENSVSELDGSPYVQHPDVMKELCERYIPQTETVLYKTLMTLENQASASHSYLAS